MPSAIELIINSNYLRSLLEAEEGENLTLEELSTKLDALSPLVDFADIATALTALAETSALYNRITDIKNILYNELGQPLWAISDRLSNCPVPTPTLTEYIFNGDALGWSTFDAGDGSIVDVSAGSGERIIQVTLSGAGTPIFGWVISPSTIAVPGDWLKVVFSRDAGAPAYQAQARINGGTPLVVGNYDDNDQHILYVPVMSATGLTQLDLLITYNGPGADIHIFRFYSAVVSLLYGEL